MPPSREPWIKLKVGIIRSDKVGSLPSGEARWGWVKVLCEAKLQRRMGVFASRKHLRSILGTHARFVSAYVTSGLLHEAPVKCRCIDSYADAGPAAGELVVHDYRDEQVQANAPIFHDPEASPGALRTKWWRLRTAVFERDSFTCRYCGTEDYERRWLVADHVVPPEKGGTDELDNLVTACRPCNKRKGGRTPEEADMPLRDTSRAPDGDVSHPSPGDASQARRDGSPGRVTSRARGTTETETGRDSLQVESPLRGRGGARASGAASNRSNNGEQRERDIARARAKLADPGTSADMREAAIARLKQLGASIEPDEPDFFGAGT